MQKLPDNLGSTTVFYLTLANNKFVGTIPRSIGKASSTLIEVLFLNNQLSGCLPYEIGYLKELVVFDVGQNRLTGQIPCSFGCLQKIEQLNLAGNMLYGMVPEVICELGNLANLSLSGNYFTQVGPICWGLIQSGVLDLRKNCVPGLPYQRSIMECAMFFAHRHKFCGYALPYSYIPCELPHAGKGGSGRKGSPSEKNLKAPSLSDSALLRHRL
ncbi:hypothetical protein GIB67_017570 [Kingdonia uniflora]|uniref:Uncharacterized protein n=1 Tax=Kingdonia uniflora TaxID=39325 RepID=A0A7J7LN32_9MAGN|nr:hypothetical protein GIB67_017570 [Kingdonia uniflora]